MKYKVIRVSTRASRHPGPRVVRIGTWDQCEAMLVRLFESKVGNLESRWAGRDMLVRIGHSGTLFIVYRIMPEES